MKCNICGEELELEHESSGVCDGCWYGMRLRPEDWIKDLKQKGIEVERGMGCQISEGGCICGDPWKKKES